MVSLISSIKANIVNNYKNAEPLKTASKANEANLFGLKNSEENALFELNFDETITPQAPEYKGADYNKIARQTGNGKFDADAIQGQIGDCGLLSTLRALRNSEGGQKAVGEIMSYSADTGEWSFNFKTKDFDGTNPIVVTQAEIDQAITEKRVSKGDDDITAMELAVEKYLQQIGDNGTQDNTVKQIFDIQNKSRNARIAAGAEDKGYLDGISPYIGYIFTGSIPKPLHTYDSNQQLAAEALESFDKSTDMLIFSQIQSGDVASGGDNPFLMLGDDQILGNHAYTVCDIEGDNVILRESNNPSETITVTKEELLNCEGKNSLYAYSAK